jgi:hypothetical protein
LTHDISAPFPASGVNQDLLDDPSLRNINHLWEEFNGASPATEEEKYCFYMGAWAVFVVCGCGADVVSVHDEITKYLDARSGRGKLQ